MILRLALRSLTAHPVRSAVLAAAFGLGVAVMATLLGVGEVILAQARSPALRGGGDVMIVGATGRVRSARYLLANVIGAPPLRPRVTAAAATGQSTLYLVRPGRVVPIRARAGIPSGERALGDPETEGIAAWTDSEADRAWAAPDPGQVLRAIDRFHPIPDVPARAASWAEWLYFNGRVGATRFYLTFLVGPARPGGKRIAGVRLQLDRSGSMQSFAEKQVIEDATLLTGTPDLTIGTSSVRLEGLRYLVVLDLPAGGSEARAASRAQGEIVVQAVPGRSLPPITIRGIGGWLSGYVVPVMAGPLSGSLVVDGQPIALDGGTAYHDHNWGFWDGVTWQWGQVQHAGLSFVFGRLHPPADAADAGRLPGFLAALGPQGPIGYSADVSIEETNDPQTRRPQRVVVTGRGSSLDLTLDLGVEDQVATEMGKAAFGGGSDFLQLRGRYRLTGRAGGQTIDLEAPGTAETFRGR